MRTRFLLFGFCLVSFLIGCFPARETMSVTRPVATRQSTETATTVPPTTIPLSTHTSEPTLAITATATSVPPTATPLPTNTPEPTWPTTPILFVREGALQRWLPQSNEVEVLVQGVNSHPIHKGEFAVFLRNTDSEQVYDLIAYHIPTQTEIFVSRVPARKLVTEVGTQYSIPTYTITVSPKGKWIGFVTENGDSIYLTLSLFELASENTTVNVRSVVPIPTDIRRDSSLYFASFSWINEDQISWATSSGIWGLNLASSSQEPIILIQPSTNTYEHPGVTDENGNYLPVRTSFLPYRWSPDGRYLIALEGKYEGGIFRMIHQATNQTVEIPEADYGDAYSDALMWLDNDRFLHFNIVGTITLWQVKSDESIELVKERVFRFESGLFANLRQISNNSIRFSFSLLYGAAKSWIYDLNFETGEFTQLSSELESREIVVYWSPNEKEVLWGPIFDEPNSLFYNPLDGQLSINFDQVFGSNSCCWHWENSSSE